MKITGNPRGATLAGVALAAGLLSTHDASAGSYHQTNLVADTAGTSAKTVDKNLVNPWGLAHSATGPWWSANQGTATSTIYTGDGQAKPLVVKIPQSQGGPNNPTGVTGEVFAGGKFVFANLDGSISAWSGGTTATQVVAGRNGGHVALYTGLAATDDGSVFYAANEITGRVDMFDGAFKATGSFTDPNGTGGLVPFNVQNVGGKIWVTYAVAGPQSDEQGYGSGLVDIFNPDGTFVKRFTEGGQLSSPWGVAAAPSTFGQFGGDILIGNFNDGDKAVINAFDPNTGAYLGVLKSGDKAIVNPGLWALAFGNGGQAGPTDTLYFTAGVGDEQHGLFGAIDAVPEPGVWAMLIVGFGGVGLQMRRSRRTGARVRHA